MYKYIWPSLIALLTLASCASSNLGTREVGQTPTDKSTFAAGMWEAFDQFEARLQHAGSRITDPVITGYVERLVCDLAAEHCPDIRVYIVQNPTFNASMAPNGMMTVNSGLLLRAENEAQLAFVLAHEIGHFLEQHSFERYAATKNASQISAFLTGGIGNIFAAGSVAAFTREQEIEADQYSLMVIADRGYDLNSAISVWAGLTAELSASDNKTKRKQATRETYFSSHPSPENRSELLKKVAENLNSVETKQNFATYRQSVRSGLLSWLTEDIALRDFGASMNLIDRLSNLGNDRGVLEFARGELYRVRGHEGDHALALASYEQSMKYEDAPAEAWRQAGDRYRAAGETSMAISALSTYLERMPDAADRGLIENVIMKLEGR